MESNDLVEKIHIKIHTEMQKVATLPMHLLQTHTSVLDDTREDKEPWHCLV